MGGWLGRTLLVPNLNHYMWALFFQVRFPEFLRTLPPQRRPGTTLAWCRAGTLYPITHPQLPQLASPPRLPL